MKDKITADIFNLNEPLSPADAFEHPPQIVSDAPPLRATKSEAVEVARHG